MKKILFGFIFFVLFSNFSFAEVFDITNYDIKLNVNKENKILINENIDVNFKQYRHGIFRIIPIKNEIIRANGSVDKTTAQISNFSANSQYSMTKNLNNVEIKFGNPDKTIFGNKNYKFKYDYQLFSKANNEFYFNIIGTQWDNNINHVNFEVTLPKDFDKNKVGFSVGSKGNVGYYDKSLEYYIKDNTIYGKTLRTLAPHEAITLRIELPDNYFQKPKIDFSKIILVIFLSIFLTSISYLIWFSYGKDEIAIPVLNFYPPKGLNSAQIGVLASHDGKTDEKAIVSLVTYLASKGYIKIHTSKDKFNLIKLKDYDGKDENEKMLMEVLFEDYKKEVSSLDLMYSRTFYLKCRDLVKNINSLREKIFEQDSIDYKTALIPILSIITLLGLFSFCLDGFSFEFLTKCNFTLAFPIIALIVFITKFPKAKLEDKIFFIIWCSLFGLGPLFTIILPNLAYSTSSLITSIIPLIGLIISFICLKELPKRNKLGIKLLGQILGFKKYIETAELNQIKMLIKKDESYGFNIIPYAYILGLDKFWLEKLEQVIKINPDWYEGDFSSRSFSSFSNSFYNASTPSTENGGISSSSSGGGGCSGGGSGGGGGGSW